MSKKISHNTPLSLKTINKHVHICSTCTHYKALRQKNPAFFLSLRVDTSKYLLEQFSYDL